jgi:hypothetical protein
LLAITIAALIQRPSKKIVPSLKLRKNSNVMTYQSTSASGQPVIIRLGGLGFAMVLSSLILSASMLYVSGAFGPMATGGLESNLIKPIQSLKELLKPAPATN